jgi:ribonuclease G
MGIWSRLIMHKVVVTRYKDLIAAIEYSSSLKPVRIFFSKQSKVTLGSIYIGRVSNIKPELNAAFVEFTNEFTGYLPLDECEIKLKEGDLIPVRVVKEPVKSKLYSLSTKLEIVGEYCVVSSSSDTVTFSKRLSADDVKLFKKAFSKVPELESAYGAIIRTNASPDNMDALISEYIEFDKRLKNIDQYKENRTLYTCLYYENPGFVKSLTDLREDSFNEIICEDLELYDFVRVVFPGKVRLHTDERISLSSLYSTKRSIELATQKKVNLKSGGYIVIEPTETMTVIDVNSGKFSNKKESKEEMIRHINKEAATEVAYQLKLRNISGMILVDFINFEDKRDENDLIEYFKMLVKDDNCKVTIYGFTRLKLLEISRQKIRGSVYDYLS